VSQALALAASRRASTSRGRGIPLTTGERQAAWAIFDAVAVLAGAGVAGALWRATTGDAPAPGWLHPLYLVAAWALALAMADGYVLPVIADRMRSAATILVAAPLAAGVGVAFFFIQPFTEDRALLVLSLVFSGALLIASRWTASRLLLYDVFARRALLTGGAEWSERLTDALAGARFEHQVVAQAPRLPLGRLMTELPGLLRRHAAHEVVLAGDDPEEEAQLIEFAFARGIPMVTAAALIERYQGRVCLETISSQLLGSLGANRLLSRPYLAIRRALDFVLAIVIGVPFVVVLPLVVAVIALDSAGPVLLRQRRVGLHGREFTMLKLRTMTVGAETEGCVWAQREDPRVTRVGRFLRATRLDEVPQLVNVLRGEMSLIGPRPERPEFVTLLEEKVPHYRARLAVRPGITGWAQVRGNYAASVEESLRKLEYDLYYVKHQSVVLDLQIALKTPLVMMGLRGR
jgi:exopolysaccharide biosynthesis polyprenyl glycosylphosphotransferase